MAISTLIWRLAVYYTRHGLKTTIRRTVLAMRRVLSSNRMVVFYCELAKQTTLAADLPSPLRVDRLTSYAELSPQELHEIIHVWNPKLAHRNMRERFDQGASLWLIKSDDSLAGYAWTLLGQTIIPYYLPLGEGDVHLFDFYVLPKYRGRAIIYFLVVHILRCLAVDGADRVFGEVEEWNQPSLSSYTITPFRRLGWARKLTIFRHTVVCWEPNDVPKQVRKHLLKQRAVVATDRNTSDALN
jgi:hypothetical protein